MSALEAPPLTQSSDISRRIYSGVFLFHHDPDDEFPFSSVNLDQFKGTDFPFELINGHLGMNDRLKPRILSRITGKNSIFAKIESGEFMAVPSKYLISTN